MILVLVLFEKVAVVLWIAVDNDGKVFLPHVIDVVDNDGENYLMLVIELHDVLLLF